MIYKHTYDPSVNAHYLYVEPPESQPGKVATTNVTPSWLKGIEVLIDYDSESFRAVGIELLCEKEWTQDDT